MPMLFNKGMVLGNSSHIHVTLQVTEKNAGTKHDFMSDPIRLIRQGDWLKVCLSNTFYSCCACGPALGGVLRGQHPQCRRLTAPH